MATGGTIRVTSAAMMKTRPLGVLYRVIAVRGRHREHEREHGADDGRWTLLMSEASTPLRPRRRV